MRFGRLRTKMSFIASKVGNQPAARVLRSSIMRIGTGKLRCRHLRDPSTGILDLNIVRIGPFSSC